MSGHDVARPYTTVLCFSMKNYPERLIPASNRRKKGEWLRSLQGRIKINIILSKDLHAQVEEHPPSPATTN
jgi:hypothetical protein